MYLEIIYIDKDDMPRRIGKGAEGSTDQWTIQSFEYSKKYEESIKLAPFLLDLKADNGDILETIGLSAEGYANITGEKPLTEKEYVDFDTSFWGGVKILAKAHDNGRLLLSS